MVKQSSDNDRISELDTLLRIDERDRFWGAALSDSQTEYSTWYSRLLSSLALMTTGDDLVYGQAEIDDGGHANIVVVTSSLIIVTRVDTSNAEAPAPRVTAVSRRNLESLSVAAGQGVDVPGSQAVGWPGRLSIQARYRGTEQTIEFRGDSYDRYSPDNVGRIWTLFKVLRSDLAGGGSQR
jgi:hypothetical protein